MTNQRVELDNSPAFYEWWCSDPRLSSQWTSQMAAYEAWRERGRRDADQNHMHDHLLEWRDIEPGDACTRCGGSGKYVYANTST